MKRRMKKVSIIMLAVLMAIGVGVPIVANAAYNGSRNLGEGIYGANNWYKNGNVETFRGQTTVQWKAEKGSGINQPWTRVYGRTGSNYQRNSTGFNQAWHSGWIGIQVNYSSYPNGYKGAYSEHTRNNNGYKWREIVGRY
ncbi:hypothetical protein [Listeria marthii]|uniref:hypothetical protein n=1 Tax=Listeria marthii TaxID=529731 RepID=UPI001628BED9|nr:hypothetical protein [Listeria marthii]MBC2001037.1 hypothetical protein [Listeria marthii]MBC2119276.1 hypothetical protein [Listeria marthii]MBF2626326.1 hypothetical protein [Listeria marthii]